MSGGHFEYEQYKIGCIADAIELLIEQNDDTTLDEWNTPRGRGYPPEVIALFREGLATLRCAQVYAQRIDWLVSGDDGEESFIARLRNDLEKTGVTVVVDGDLDHMLDTFKAALVAAGFAPDTAAKLGVME